MLAVDARGRHQAGRWVCGRTHRLVDHYELARRRLPRRWTT